jgi:FKBP-type peptidyl-prolyl cis-trans isomerase
MIKSMKNLMLFAGVLCLLASAACAQKGEKNRKSKKVELKSEMDSISYILGAGMGKNIRQNDISDVDIDIVMAGLVDGIESDSAMKISFKEGNDYVRAYAMKKQKMAAEDARAEADAYMEKMMAEGKLQSTESGILYEVVEMGDGPKPTKDDKVKVNYEGKTTDGEIFDSSYERGKPAEFPLTRVIPGWTEILQEMPVGSTFIATIPPQLAYGERGSPPNIGPNEVLIFKIELLDITTGK